MITKQPHFIIVDDDPINNFITKKVITKISPNAFVIAFTEPEDGLDYILSIFAKPFKDKAILLLDINMPAMTGWQFMEVLEKKGSIVNERLSTYILSSSVDPADKERARVNLQISDYIMKPLSHEAVLSISSIKAGGL